MRPDLVEAVSGAALPYLSAAGPFLPIEQLATLVPALSYQVSSPTVVITYANN